MSSKYIGLVCFEKNAYDNTTITTNYATNGESVIKPMNIIYRVYIGHGTKNGNQYELSGEILSTEVEMKKQ